MPTLLDPIRIGAWNLRNRVIMAPLTRCRCSEGRVPNALMAEYYRQRASAGMIISEATSISADGRGLSRYAGHLVRCAGRGLEARHQRGARGGRDDPAAALARRPHLRSGLSRRQTAGGAERHRGRGPRQPDPPARRRSSRRAPSSWTKFPASSRIIAGARRTRRQPASTASSCTARTATCSTNFCRTARTSARMSTAARSRTARG